MFDFNTLSEFSRDNCIGICAFLVPANLFSTLQTMIFTGLNRPQWQVKYSVSAAIAYALVIILHVLTWFWAGVVMAPTYILLILGSVCLILNTWAIAHPGSMASLLKTVWLVISDRLLPNWRQWQLSVSRQSGKTV